MKIYVVQIPASVIRKILGAEITTISLTYSGKSLHVVIKHEIFLQTQHNVGHNGAHWLAFESCDVIIRYDNIINIHTLITFAFDS